MEPTHEDSLSEDGSHGEHPLTDASSASAITTKASDSASSLALSAAPPSSSAQGTGPALAGSSKSRRRLGVITRNACSECRKKHAKCDGQKPCGRCKARDDVQCTYDTPVRQSKESLRTEVKQRRRQLRSYDSILAALVQPQLHEEILRRLQNGQNVKFISHWLGEATPAAAREGDKGGGYTQAPKRPIDPNDAFSTCCLTSADPSQYTSAVVTSLGQAVSAVAGHTQGLPPDTDQTSPWAGKHLSPHSQSVLRSKSHSDAMDVMDQKPNTRGSPQFRAGSWVDSFGVPGRHDGQQYRLPGQAPVSEIRPMKVPQGTWTHITGDALLVEHLLALYFCWEYPMFAPLSKEHFFKDFRDGRSRYCSPILVNAILALGCRFSSQPYTRAQPDDPHTSGDHFFKECLRLYHEERNHHNMTTVQALGIMSLREASCGRGSKSWYYACQSIRLAVEMGLHQIDDKSVYDDEMTVRAATFWGAFALDHAWSLATGSLPHCSCFPYLPSIPTIVDDVEASLWLLYTDDGSLQRSYEQASNIRSVYKCSCELSELVHQSLYILHSPGRPVTSRDLMNSYTQYLNWYDRIPEVLRLGHNFTPAVLFTHMYYHFAILMLFRPLIKLRIIGSAILPRDVCSQAADAIQGMLRSYSRLYTLRRTPSFVPYFVLTSSIMHLVIGASMRTSSKVNEADVSGENPSQSRQASEASVKVDSRVTEAISRGIADLTEMAPCHHFAEQALNILRYLVKKCNIDVKISDEFESFANEKQDPDFGVRPDTNSPNFFAPDVLVKDFIRAWGTDSNPMTERHPTDVAVNPMETPLFWPFPVQVKPMLFRGQLLKDAGFEML